MKTAALELTPPVDIRRVDAHLILGQVVNPETPSAQEIFASAESGGMLTMPDNHLGSGEVELPTLHIETPRGNEAFVTDVHGTNKTLDRLYRETVGMQKGMDRRVTEMAHSTLLRVLDTSGAEGLHHIHDTVFPYTVYHTVRRGKGLMTSVYVTQLGQESSGVPVYGLLSATNNKKNEVKFVDTIGADTSRKRFRV